MKKFLILSLIFLTSCSLNKVIHHHGIHNLEKKQEKLKMNITNKNDVAKIIGPPITKSTFDQDVYIYIERKTSSSKLSNLGKKDLIKNDVLVLQFDSKGLLANKNFYNKDDLRNINFDNEITAVNYSRKSFIINFLNTLRQKIDDPLGKKRIKN